MHIPSDRELDTFFEFHPYLTLWILILFGFGCLEFLTFICKEFFS